MGIRRFTIAVGAAAILLAVSPAGAETPAQLDALTNATAQPGSGIALARRQIAGGTLLDALATLERVMINSPKNNEARMLHASVMCRLDDRRGAVVELDQMRGRQIPDSLWAEANQACSDRRER